MAIGLLASIAGAATLTAISGARRTASVFDRHTALTRGPDAWVTPDFDPALWGPGALDPVLEIDSVTTHTEAIGLAMRPVGSDHFLLFDRVVAGALDERFGIDLARFRILEGRRYDHRREDEVLLSEEYAKATRLGVGDTVRFESWTPRAIERAFSTNFDAGQPDGAVVELTVVGVVRDDFSLPLQGERLGTAYVTDAFTRRWRSRIGTGFPIGVVQLEEGGAGVASFRDDVRSVTDDIELEAVVFEASARTAGVEGAMDAQVLALAVFAAVAAGAGAVVTFAALARQLSFAHSDQRALRAIGMTRTDRGAALVLLTAPAALVAGVVSGALAMLASGLLPIGTPGRVEPDPGLRADPMVLGLGALAIAVTFLLLAAVVARSVTRPAATTSPGLVHRGAGISIARWLAVSAPVSIGMRQALDRGRGDRELPTRSTLLGCAAGLTGIVAGLAFAASLDHLTSTPRLYGWAPDATVWSWGGPEEWQQLAGELENDPAIDELATVISTTFIADEQPVGAVVLDLRRGDPFNVIISGRAPRSRDEVSIGAGVAATLDADVGDTISLALADGSASPFTVVGLAAHPNDFAGYRDQITVLGVSTERFLTYDEGPFYGALVRFAEGLDAKQAIESLRARGLQAALPPPPPRAVTNLDEVEVFPRALAAVLGLLAAVFLLHALAAVARRRAGELAVLKVIGFTRGQLRSVAVSQGTTIALVGLAVAIPLGLGIGRLAWALLATGLGVAIEHRLPSWAVAWIVVAVLLAGVFSLAAARRTVHIRPAAQLRNGHLE